jgi:hypothetical protein
MAKDTQVRVPGARLLPTYDKLRVDTSEDSEIFIALKDGGCARPADNLSIILDLPNQIEWVIRFYLSDKVFALSPPDFRKELSAFTKPLSVFVANFPAADSTLDNAIQEHLTREEDRYRDVSQTFADDTDGPVMCDPSVFMARMRAGLKLLSAVTTELALEEGGRGRDSDRALNCLMRGLKSIWRDFTGAEPGQGGDPYETGYRTPFERFTDAVFAVLPPMYRPRSSRYQTRKMNRAKSPKKA